jgi:hypothetical protein
MMDATETMSLSARLDALFSLSRLIQENEAKVTYIGTPPPMRLRLTPPPTTSAQQLIVEKLRPFVQKVYKPGLMPWFSRPGEEETITGGGGGGESEEFLESSTRDGRKEIDPSRFKTVYAEGGFYFEFTDDNEDFLGGYWPAAKSFSNELKGQRFLEAANVPYRGDPPPSTPQGELSYPLVFTVDAFGLRVLAAGMTPPAAAKSDDIYAVREEEGNLTGGVGKARHAVENDAAIWAADLFKAARDVH